MEYAKAIRNFYEDYYFCLKFKKWQDELARKIYSSLNSNVYSGEVKTVTDLCDVMSKQSHKGLHIESRKIHGWNTSGVKFDYINGKEVRKELGDMVIVSVVTFNRRIMLLKTAFIQNKKAHKNSSCSWGIDQGQLLLLKNFPTFTGVGEIFKNKTITFLNHSGTLGNYGLFTPTGDMVFLTAKNVFCNQSSNGKDTRTITFDDIKKASSLCVPFDNNVNSISFYCNDCCRYIDFDHEKYFPFLHGRYNLPFFNNYSYALDVHEIVKELTCFNIGEPLSVLGYKTNGDLYDYTNDLLRSAFGYSIEDDYFDSNRENDNISNESGANVILVHGELGERRG